MLYRFVKKNLLLLCTPVYQIAKQINNQMAYLNDYYNVILFCYYY